MLIQISVALTEGETPSAVFINPCTIQGWRPFSVSIQPAVFMMNGVTTAHTAARRNHLDVASLRRCTSHAPHSASAAIAVARYAITRIDQYWMKTFGT